MLPSVWIMSAIPCALLLAIALLGKRQLGSWLGPSTFLAMYWAVALFIPLSLAPEFDFWPGASWFILLMVAVFHAGVVIGARQNPFIIRISKAGVRRTYHLVMGKWLLLLAAVAGIGAALALALGAGFSPSALLSLNKWNQVGMHYARSRYIAGQPAPLTVNILSTFLYMGAGLGGVWVATHRRRRAQVWGTLPLVLGLVQAFLTNSRAGLMWQLTLFVGSYAASLVLTGQDRTFLSLKRIVQVITGILLFIVVFVVIQAIRDSGTLVGASLPLTKLQIYALSPPFAFSHWLRDAGSKVQPQGGGYTFGWLGYFLGIRGEPGLGWEGTSIRLGGRTWSPNIYTAFRLLVEDFAPGGALVAFAIFGVVIGTAYHEVHKGKSGWLPLLALFYAVTLGSYLSNWMTYTTPFLGWVLFALSLSRAGAGLLRRQPGLTPGCKVVPQVSEGYDE